MQRVEVNKWISTIIFARSKFILVFVCFKRFGIQMQNVTRIPYTFYMLISESACKQLEQKIND